MSTENKRTLYLFADTNLFIQCLPLEELDWSTWKEFVEVQLIVSRPVQREIDNQKNQGNNRVAKRARRTNGMFGQIIDSEQGFKVIRDECPRVTLHLGGPSLPSSELLDRLDYSKTDDEIIGFLHRFKQDNPNNDVRLLTHDVGLRLTANNLGLSSISISDSWLLPSENNEVEKENARLKLEIDRLKRLEPEFVIKLRDKSEQEIESIEVQYEAYEPLNNQDIEELISLLMQRFPMVTDFANSQKRRAALSYGVVETIPGQLRNPPSADQIVRYVTDEYPNWIMGCKRVLSTLHKALERRRGRPSILFSIANKGSRPGRDTLIEFNALGKFKISPPLDDFPDPYLEREDMQIDLPPPAIPPKSQPIGGGISRLTLKLDNPNKNPSVLMSSLDPSHDPNGFYYKHKFPVDPVSCFCLSCDQWRHGSTDQEFVVETCLDAHRQQVKGYVECVVHAENISNPERKRFPITIKVAKLDTKNYAYKMIQDLRRIRS